MDEPERGIAAFPYSFLRCVIYRRNKYLKHFFFFFFDCSSFFVCLFLYSFLGQWATPIISTFLLIELVCWFVLDQWPFPTLKLFSYEVPLQSQLRKRALKYRIFFIIIIILVGSETDKKLIQLLVMNVNLPELPAHCI